MKKMELLAPAGNFDCLKAAVQSGADAVYLSGKAFGARSYADNFDNCELEKAVDYCHLRGAKVYVTVNTLVSDVELDSVCQYLCFLSKIGVDAIIVQDLGIVKIAKEIVPNLPIHASTQMSVHNSQGVKMLEKLGMKRIVLARETSIADIKKISENTNAELEIFGHGALCMSYSGQCLMSSIIGSRSGNRGKCAQPCRLPYSYANKSEKKFYMSLKDLSSLAHIKDLQASGVASLKIEGRMKGGAYVAAVVGVYRKYIDNPSEISKSDLELLNKVFNRGGLTDGYLTGEKGPDMFAFDKPDNPYLKGSNELETSLLNGLKNENRKRLLECNIEIRIGEPPKVSLGNELLWIDYVGESIAEIAENISLDRENVRLRFGKTGGTPFEFSRISVNLDENVFLSAGEINKLRRNALELFEKEYLKLFKREEQSVNQISNLTNSGKTFEGGYVCEITAKEQFLAVKDFEYKLFYVPLDLLKKSFETFKDFKNKIVIVPPAIVSEGDLKDTFKDIENLIDSGFYGILAHNISFFEHFKVKKVFGGFRLNIFNSHSLEFCKDYGFEAVELSPELSLKQMKNLTKNLSTQVMVYGRLPLMVTENCVVKNMGGCPCSGIAYITDRIGMQFPIVRDGDSCRNVILNCKKTFCGFDIDKIQNAGISYFRVYFTDESPEECKKITETFLHSGEYRPVDYTNGHFSKGVL